MVVPFCLSCCHKKSACVLPCKLVVFLRGFKKSSFFCFSEFHFGFTKPLVHGAIKSQRNSKGPFSDDVTQILAKQLIQYFTYPLSYLSRYPSANPPFWSCDVIYDWSPLNELTTQKYTEFIHSINYTPKFYTYPFLCKLSLFFSYYYIKYVFIPFAFINQLSKVKVVDLDQALKLPKQL